MAVDINRAIDIGEQILRIDAAILQGKIAHSNYSFYNSDKQTDFYDSELFKRLEQTREEYREELRKMG